MVHNLRIVVDTVLLIAVMQSKIYQLKFHLKIKEDFKIKYKLNFLLSKLIMHFVKCD